MRGKIDSLKRWITLPLIFFFFGYFGFELSRVNFLLTHTLAEGITILIGFAIFAILWHTQEKRGQAFYLIVGISLVSVGTLDAFHSFSYPGSNFLPSSTNLGTQLWVSSRLLQAVSFFAAVVWGRAKVDKNRLLIFYMLLTAVLLAIIYRTNWFPLGFVEGKGQTSFKLAMEYLVCLFSLAALLWMLKGDLGLPKKLEFYFIIGLFLNVISEIIFTFYANAYAISNYLGHWIKILYFTSYYWGIVHWGLKEPATALKTARDHLSEETIKLKDTQAFLLNSNKRNQTILETTQEGFLVVDEQGRIQEINETFCLLTGFWREELLNQHLDKLTASKATSLWEQMPGAAAKGKKAFEGVIQPKSGPNKVVEVKTSFIVTGVEKLFVSFLQDITERRKMEAERHHLVSALEQVAEGMAILDTDWVIQYSNLALSQLFSSSSTKLIGTPLPQILSGDFWQQQEEINQKLRFGGKYNSRMPMKANQQPFYGELAISPLFGPDRELLNYIILLRDVSEQVEMEKELIQSQKMQAIGTLAGGVAHDFNNILYAMVLYLKLAKKESVGQTKLEEYLDQALTAGDRAKNLIQQILTFSRKEETQFHPLDLIEAIHETNKLLRATLNKQIQLNFTPSLSHCYILADSTQIQQVLMNLIGNSAQALGDSPGKIELECEILELDPSFAQNLGIPPGPYVSLIIQDNGPGIPPELKDRVFEPFFTTKAAGEGTGMGLAVVHGIIAQCKGAILLKDNIPQGLRMEILLPQLLQTEKTPQPSLEAQAPLTPIKILLIDDEPAIVKATGLLLESMGHQVQLFTDATTALDWLRTQKGKVDLVFSDLSMPKMNGETLTQKIKTHWPQLPVVLITGFADTALETRLRQKGVDQVLFKPIGEEQLSQTIQACLAKG